MLLVRANSFETATVEMMQMLRNFIQKFAHQACPLWLDQACNLLQRKKMTILVTTTPSGID